MGSFPYHSHIFRDSYGSGMGIVWEASHKGVPLLGVPENPIDLLLLEDPFRTSRSAALTALDPKRYKLAWLS